MILTKYDLDLRSPSARQALIDCEDMHRNVQALFDGSRRDAGVLYRAKKTEKGCSVYVLSACLPECGEEASRLGMVCVGNKDLALIETLFTEGRTFRFELLTMPSKKEADRTRKNSPRKVLRNPEERLNWLQRKAEQNGFRLLSVSEEEGETLRARKQTGELWLHTTLFSGMLQITEPETFCAAWKNRVGPEKAYGLGMLMLR